jgi:hypothetical protein
VAAGANGTASFEVSEGAPFTRALAYPRLGEAHSPVITAGTDGIDNPGKEVLARAIQRHHPGPGPTRAITLTERSNSI